MSDVICRRCQCDTCHTPPEVPPEWDGYCPGCALKLVLNKELPAGSFYSFIALLINTGNAGSLFDAVMRRVADEPDLDDMDISMSGTGQMMAYHKPEVCQQVSYACPIHSPSDHHMRTWPMHGRTDLELPLLERICPHNATHPDPDSLKMLQALDETFDPLHGACDGCCRTDA